MLRSLLVAVSSIALAVSCTSTGGPTLVVENARVIVGNGEVLERGTVVIERDRIVSVGIEPVDAPAAHRIDAAGRTVLPGLIDTHVHVLMERLFAQPRSEAQLLEFVDERLPDRLQAFLDAGITTVMSSGDFWPLVSDVRDGIRAGETAGPRLYTAGPLITAPEGHPAVTFCGSLDINGPNPWCREHLTVEVDTAREARDTVDRLKTEGVDLIKIVYDGTDGSEVKKLKSELIDPLLEASQERGLRVYSHSLDMRSAITAIERGIDGLVHLPAVSSQPDELERLTRLMVSSGVPSSTTLVTFDSMVELVAEQGDQETERYLRGILTEMESTLARLAVLDADLVSLGTDAPHLLPGDAYSREIELVSAAGLTPHQVIEAATRNGAVFMGLADELGTLESGKLADLIIIDGNPLTDLSTLRNIVTVIKDGEIVVSK